MRLADVNSRVMKELAEKLTAANLSAATIRDYLNNSKVVVASATDENGEELFPRRWNAEFIDAPPIRDQRQPSTNAEGMIAIVGTATGQYQMLRALLAGCGPMRAGEALGLDIDKHISPDFRTLYIRQKAKQGIIQDHLKTENGKRDVDLCRPLADMLRGYVGTRTSGLLFHTASGKQLSQRNILRACLHPILKKLGLERGGLNIFRRFRITHVGKSDCPEALKHFWSGHAQRHVSERYTKLLQELEYRLDWAGRIGLGFELSTKSEVGRPGRFIMFRKVG